METVFHRTGSSRWGAALGLTAGIALWPSTVSAHVDAVVTPDNIWRTWNLDPLILLPLLLFCALYSGGVRKIWARSAVGRGVTRWQVAAFAAGNLMLVVALLSPLDPLGGALFSAHMLQHLLFMLVVAPLLVYAAPLAPVLIVLPRSWRRRAGKVSRLPQVRSVVALVRHPLAVWSIQAIVLWIWHIPVLYDAALSSQLVHSLQHGAFLSASMLFWWVVIQPHGRRTLELGTAVIFIFTTAMHSSALGALLTFAPAVWYEGHLPFVAAWDLTVLEDQQLAGLLMWVPAGVVYLLAALLAFGLWLRSVDRAQTAGNRTPGMLDSDAGTDRSHSPRSG